MSGRQGSIVAVSKNTGAKVQVNTYDAYGQTAAGNTARFQYTGQAAIPELGLLYYKARFYNPALGRFMQTDPIGYDDDNNLYTYSRNDPLNRVDPSGLCSSINDKDKRADCDKQREIAVKNAKEHVAPQSVRSGAREGAYIATYDEETGEVSVRTGDDAAQRTNADVGFLDERGQPLAAQPDGRIIDRNEDGSRTVTSKIVLATGHTHPSQAGGGRINSVDNANESIRSNRNDRNLSRIAPAVIKTPSGAVKVFVNERERVDEQQ